MNRHVAFDAGLGVLVVVRVGDDEPPERFEPGNDVPPAKCCRFPVAKCAET